MIVRALFLVPALLAAMLAGCAKPYLDIPEPNKRQKAEAEVALQHAQVGPARNTAADEMVPTVRRVIRRVRASSYTVCTELKLPDERCKLMLKAKVLVYTKEKDINAFADGKDNVSVLGGLVRNMGTDAEIAGVLAHEFAHVMYGHVEKKTENALISGLILGSIAAGLAAAAGADGRQMVKDSTQLGGEIGSHAYSPEMEIEADRTAIYILRNAGLPLTAMQNALLRMSRAKADNTKEAAARRVGFLETHPSDNRRLAHLISAVEDAQAGVALKPADPKSK